MKSARERTSAELQAGGQGGCVDDRDVAQQQRLAFPHQNQRQRLTRAQALRQHLRCAYPGSCKCPMLTRLHPHVTLEGPACQTVRGFVNQTYSGLHTDNSERAQGAPGGGRRRCTRIRCSRARLRAAASPATATGHPPPCARGLHTALLLVLHCRIRVVWHCSQLKADDMHWATVQVDFNTHGLHLIVGGRACGRARSWHRPAPGWAQRRR